MGILHGTLPALVTPYSNKDINETEFRKYLNFLLENGCDGLFCNGSAGDSQALSLEKQLQLLRICKEESKEKPLITGIGSPCYETTKNIAEEARKIGADALLLMMPYYYKFDDDTLYEYTKNLLTEIDLPLYIYNIPLFAPPLSLNLIERLAKLDGIVGIKDSSGDALLLQHILDVVPSDFDVFVGREDFYALGLIAGAKGSMTAIGGVFPEIMNAINQAIKDKNITKALSLQKELLPVIRFAMSVSFPLGFKLLLEERGFNFNHNTIHPLSVNSKNNLEKDREEAKEYVKRLSNIEL